MCTLYLYHDLNKLTVKRHFVSVLRKLRVHKVSDDTRESLLTVLGMMMVQLDKKMSILVKSYLLK